MCGIVGFASSEGMKNRGLRQHYMEQGLAMDSFRGWDSTGVACIERIDEKPLVYKRALNGFDFIQQQKTQRFLSDIEKYQVMIGHNRSATKGSVKDDNAHPFQYDHITLVHNGHINNAFELPNNTGADNFVDSSRVALSMARNGEKETLELVDGGFTFVWWNQETKKLNIARNDKRPLWVGYADGENTMFWASEWELLNLLVYRNGGTLEEHTVMFPDVSTWYQYDLKDLRKAEKVPFVLSQGRRTTQGGNTGGQANTSGNGNDADDWAQQIAEWNQTLQDIRTEDATVKGGTTKSEIDEIHEDAKARRTAPDGKATGIPTTKKKIAKASQALGKLGIKFREKVLCSPISWVKYENQISLGCVLAKVRKHGMTVEIGNVKATDYAVFHDKGLIAVEIVNMRSRRGEGGVIRAQLVGVVSTKMNNYLERSKSREEPDKGHGIGLLYVGPSGNLISLEKFKEVTKNGCGWCSEPADPATSDRLVWMAGGDFLCSACSSDKEVLADVGIISNDNSNYAVVH